MKTIRLNNYGTLIGEALVGKQIYDIIKENIHGEDTISIDFTGVISMATFCARQIFGKLYIELGPSEFKQKLILCNANNSIKSVITEAIRYSVSHNS